MSTIFHDEKKIKIEQDVKLNFHGIEDLGTCRLFNFAGM
jgi:hypothetical protein